MEYIAIAVKPVLQALVLAERIYTDESGKRIICGTFNGIEATSTSIEISEAADGTKQATVPGGDDSGSPYAYISITDVVDETDLLLQFVNLTKNRVLFEKTMTVRCQNRLSTVEIVTPLPSLSPFLEIDRNLDGPGQTIYAFEVICDGDILGSHRLVVNCE